MLQQLVLVFLVLSVNVHQCHSFKHVKRKPALPISTTQERKFCHHPSHCYQSHQNCCQSQFNSAKQQIHSIRGGSDNHEIDNEDDETTHDFISSFESELAQIRHEISMEAENEIQKLRGLIEGGDDVDPEHYESNDGSNVNGKLEAAMGDDDDESAENDVIREQTLRSSEGGGEAIDQSEIDIQNETKNLNGSIERREDAEEEGETDPEYHEKIDESKQNAKLEAAIESDGDEPIENDAIQDKEVETLSDEGDAESIEKSEIESDEVKDKAIKAIDQPEIGSEVGEDREEESISVEDAEDFQRGESEYPAKPNEDSDLANSDSEGMSDGGKDSIFHNNKSSAVRTRVGSKPEKSKKKRNRNTKARKARAKLAEEDNSPDGRQVVMEESILLTRTEDEVMQPLQSGIFFYLRSDLGRALVLFVATVVIAIMTQRVQRQMEAEGI